MYGEAGFAVIGSLSWMKREGQTDIWYQLVNIPEWTHLSIVHIFQCGIWRKCVHNNSSTVFPSIRLRASTKASLDFDVDISNICSPNCLPSFVESSSLYANMLWGSLHEWCNMQLCKLLANLRAEYVDRATLRNTITLYVEDKPDVRNA